MGGSPALRGAGTQMLLGCAAVPGKLQPLLPASLPSLKEQTLALLSGKGKKDKVLLGRIWGFFGFCGFFGVF